MYAVRSTSGARRTVIRALLAGRPLEAAMMVWKPASPSPGMLVWTSSTLGSVSRMVSASVARSSTACDDAPAGGATVTARIFSEPALMNCVGRSGTISDVAKNSATDTPTTPSFVQRLRRANVIAGT